jgi:hypothetical protein
MAQETSKVEQLAEAEFKMVCERPPAAFGGSPPHEGENKVISPS